MTHAKLMKMDNVEVKCVIDGEGVLGIISVEDKSVFVCQDIFKGKPCKDKKGKKCSWLISTSLEPYEEYDRHCSDIVIVENKWIRREEELKETGEIEYVGKNKVLRKVGEEYLLFDKPNIANIRDSIPDLVLERLKGKIYEDKNLLFLNNIQDRNIFYIDAGDSHYDCLAIIIGDIPVSIPVPVIIRLYNCTIDDINTIYNQKIEKEVWAKHFATFYIARK